MMRIRFQTTLKSAPRGGAACELDVDIKEILGKARAPVSVTIHRYTFRTTTIAMDGRYFLGINKAHQAGAGVAVGDTFWVDLKPDDERRVVKAPADLEDVFRASPRLRAAWERLSYTRQKEHARGLEDAKKPETRARRRASLLESLHRATPPTSRKK